MDWLDEASEIGRMDFVGAVSTRLAVAAGIAGGAGFLAGLASLATPAGTAGAAGVAAGRLAVPAGRAAAGDVTTGVGMAGGGGRTERRFDPGTFGCMAD